MSRGEYLMRIVSDREKGRLVRYVSDSEKGRAGRRSW
jgi:hypothetical protein